MGIHVNIGEAKTRLSELVAAALRGEDVIIARNGKAEIRLQPISEDEVLAGRRAERKSWFGRYRGMFPPDFGDSFLQPTFTDEEMDAFADEKAERIRKGSGGDD